MHISYVELISIVCDRLKVCATSMKMFYTSKFDPTMLVLLEDDEEMRKMFRFNDTYCFVYFFGMCSSGSEFVYGRISNCLTILLFSIIQGDSKMKL